MVALSELKGPCAANRSMQPIEPRITQLVSFYQKPERRAQSAVNVAPHAFTCKPVASLHSLT